MPDLAAIATQYGCSTRTVSRWQAAGAPLDDPARMRVWLAGRKHLPPQPRLMLTTERKARRRAAATEAGAVGRDDSIGAAAALKRLEQAEVASYTRFQSAQATGDPVEMKLAREDWIRIGDSLRRYDLLVEQSRRDSGELVPRAELETQARNMSRAFRQAC